MVENNDSNVSLNELNVNSKKLFSEFVESSKNAEKRHNVIPSQTDYLTMRDDVVLFVSYDIVNSTDFKTRHHNGWPVVLASIIESIKTTVRASAATSTAQAEVWRVLGDEVIFVLPITSVDQLNTAIDGFYEVLISLCYDLDDSCFYNSLRGLSEEIKQSLISDIKLSVKGTAWIANVKTIDSIDAMCSGNDIENIHEINRKEGRYIEHDFLGIDIDTGFRIAKKTRSKQMVMSFELAYLLYEYKKLEDNLFIVTYEKLPGVWNEREYPIIWYYDKAKSKNEDEKGADNVNSFINSLPYDAESQDELYKECILNNSINADNKKYSIKNDILKK